MFYLSVKTNPCGNTEEKRHNIWANVQCGDPTCPISISRHMSRTYQLTATKTRSPTLIAGKGDWKVVIFFVSCLKKIMLTITTTSPLLWRNKSPNKTFVISHDSTQWNCNKMFKLWLKMYLWISIVNKMNTNLLHIGQLWE